MDAQEQLFGLIEAAEAQQKAAAATIAAMAQERRELLAASEAIRKAAGTLQYGLQEAAGHAVRDSLSQGMESAEQATHRAVRVLSAATDQLHEAGTWVSFKTAAAVGLAGALAVGAVYGIGRYLVASTMAEIADLRAQKAELQANVDDLARYGGQATKTGCSLDTLQRRVRQQERNASRVLTHEFPSRTR